MTRPDPARIVALGASNLTRGFYTIVSTARAVRGPQVEVVSALGHGRSYGIHSWFAARTLPGILQSGLWRHLDAMLAWVDETVSRLRRVTQDIVLTDLPLDRARRLTRVEFLAFRTVIVPQCRLTLANVLDTAGRVNDGLAEIAAARGIQFFRLRPEWYGLDPIHIRPSLWRSAWQEILYGESVDAVDSGAADVGRSRSEALRLYLLRPERQWMFGREQFTAQHGVPLRHGGRVWLF